MLSWRQRYAQATMYARKNISTCGVPFPNTSYEKLCFVQKYVE